MSYQLWEINRYAREEPRVFLQKSDALFQEKLEKVGVQIFSHREKSPLVLLSGPSSSGKTTVAFKLSEILNRFGVHTHVISMDDYFYTIDPETAPRTPTGEMDFESPDCLDWKLLNQHLTLLKQGKEIFVPKFDFSRNTRSATAGRKLKIDPGEIVILEGIHALRGEMSEHHPDAIKLYVSTQSDILNGSCLYFQNSWTRLVRRIVRDARFRGAGVERTLSQWGNIQRGEKQYIIPFEQEADISINSSLPYEVMVMKQAVIPLLKKIPQDSLWREKMEQFIHVLDAFQSISPTLVSTDSLLREFIGGGRYQY